MPSPTDTHQAAPTRRRRVLMLAYFFPPLGGAGVQRTAKYVKHLPAEGWDVTVVTTASQAYPVTDPSLLAEVPAATRVVRAREVPGWRWTVDQLAKVLDVLGLLRYLPLLRWPDDMAPWMPGALAATLREVRRDRPDVLYSTSAPYGAHLVAWAVHRITGIPWVADFRDEWAANPHARDQPTVVRRLSRRTEAAITRAAAEVTVVADYFELAGGAPRTTIPNGVDADDLPAAVARRAPGDRLRLSFVGTLYAEQDCRPVLEALRRLRDDGRLPASAVELRVVGNVWLPDAEALLPPGTVQTGYVDHRTAIAEMRAADALLFYVAPSSRAPSGKLYEYLASERPILCVARRDNLAFELVQGWDAGMAVEPGDAAGIERALVELHRRWAADELRDVPQARERTLARFSRAVQARALAAVLERAARR